MTMAVLKNRLLTLTHREFHESHYGVHTMREFVWLARDVVRIDDTTDPPTIALLNAAREQGAEIAITKPRVRPDLWRAMLDYSHGSPFVWDPDIKKAREASPGDNLPVLPTISESDLREWRTSFAEQNALLALDDKTREQLRTWSEHTLSSKVLPRSLASAWLAELVGRVVEGLRTWFAANAIEEPLDLVQQSTPSKPYVLRINSDLAALRQLIIGCVEVMDERELSELRISPAVLLRVTQEKRRGN